MILHCLGKHKKDSFARCLSRFLPVPISYLLCSTRGASRASSARCPRNACHSYARCTSGTSRASKPRGTSDARGSRRTRYTRRTSCARCSSGAGRSRDAGAAGASGQAVRFRKHFIALLIAGTREAPADADSVVSCHFSSLVQTHIRGNRKRPPIVRTALYAANEKNVTHPLGGKIILLQKSMKHYNGQSTTSDEAQQKAKATKKTARISFRAVF